MIGHKINKFLLLSRIIKSELQRQNEIFRVLGSQIHNDLLTYIGDYQSPILSKIKDDVIGDWNDFRKITKSDSTKINIQTVLNELNTHANDKEMKEIENSIDFSIFIHPLLKKETIQQFLSSYNLNFKVIDTEKEYIIGFEIEDLDITAICLKTLDNIAQGLQMKLQEMEILLEDGLFILHKLEY